MRVRSPAAHLIGLNGPVLAPSGEDEVGRQKLPAGAERQCDEALGAAPASTTRGRVEEARRSIRCAWGTADCETVYQGGAHEMQCVSVSTCATCRFAHAD